MATPWYQNLTFGNYGLFPDPQGPYPKPDFNFCNPGGTPITALLPGTVTSVSPQHFGGEIGTQYSVTVRNDSPPNSMAQYSAYNYVVSPSVSVGQHLNFGDTLASSLGSGVCSAFALTDRSPYGTGTFTGDPKLDPTSLVKSIQGGSVPTSGAGSGGVTDPSFWLGLTEHVFIFIVALVAIVVGFLVMNRKPQTGEPT